MSAVSTCSNPDDSTLGFTWLALIDVCAPQSHATSARRAHLRNFRVKQAEADGRAGRPKEEIWGFSDRRLAGSHQNQPGLRWPFKGSLKEAQQTTRRDFWPRNFGAGGEIARRPCMSYTVYLLRAVRA